MPASKGFGLNPQLPHVTTVGTLNDVLLGPLGASRWRIRKGWDLSAAMAVTLAWGVFHHHDHNDDNNHYRQATRFFHVTKNHGHTVIPKKYRRYLVHTCTHHVHFFALALWNPSSLVTQAILAALWVLATWQYPLYRIGTLEFICPKNPNYCFWMVLDDLIHNMKGCPRIGRWAMYKPSHCSRLFLRTIPNQLSQTNASAQCTASKPLLLLAGFHRKFHHQNRFIFNVS